MTNAARYRVSYTTTVDHPEKRCSTYPVVPKGHHIVCDEIVYGRQAAMATAHYWMGESNVFESEYVSRVQVTHELPNGGYRWHLHVTRNRNETWWRDERNRGRE